MDLKALSASLNLSMTTVSRALNGYSDVSEKTRLRVIEAARALGYQPNVVARNLALGRADAIGVVYPLEMGDVADPRFLEVVSGITEGLAPFNMDLLIASASQKGELDTYDQMIRSRRVDGFIVSRTCVQDQRIDYLRQVNVPFLAYGRTADCSVHPWFDYDNEAGSVLAVERLVGLGHRHIAYIHASLHYNFAHQRYTGYLKGMLSAGIAPSTNWILRAGLARCSGYNAMVRLLEQPRLPTAVIIDNNLAGVGAIRVLIDRGIVMGKDLSVIVYDGIPPDTLLVDRQITSVVQPTPHRAGKRMAQLIQQVITNARPLKELQVLCQPEILVGNSDGPLTGS
ncbi:substrate-binding domain-containing protein [Chitinimonas sp. BJB300]|uniref:substrate-binding domain-containing protein n=1 Tax=Chitinimonas sp. BJB300 TaxID=1559339 RepID=UPI000C0E8717|nr:substrate-binding domain-containing protein [Chitinimonas sp. BJB300]PHV12519.1 LacI family transcriptional regulator [Chitinimonas sp. BJB300]TSJ91131.1 LacI family DNA-binding transcriptional regulator [Chitinimonas sp. BJB300]